MSIIVDEQSFFNTAVEEVFFAPLQDVKADDYFFIIWGANDDDEQGLIDDTGWTEVLTGAEVGSNCEVVVYYKKVAADNEVPTGIDNYTGNDLWANILLVRGLDLSDPMDDYDGTYVSTSTTPTCPTVTSTQANQIVIRAICTDGQNFTAADPIQLIYKTTDFLSAMETVDAAATGTYATTIALADQWAACTLVLKRASGDTTTPIVVKNEAGEFDTITPLTGYTHNGDQWRQEVIDSSRCIDYAGARKTWAIDMAKSWDAAVTIVQLDNISGGDWSVGNYARGTTSVFQGEIVDIYSTGGTRYIYLKGTSGGTPVNNEVWTEYTDGTYGTPTGVTALAQGGGFDGVIGVNDMRFNDNIDLGRIVSITGLNSGWSIPDGLYYAGPATNNLNSATLGRYRTLTTDTVDGSYDDGTLQTIPSEQTGTGNVTDVGMVIYDYNTTTPFAYPNHPSGTTAHYFNVNMVGNNKVFTSAEDLSVDITTLFFRPYYNNNHSIYFWACDTSGNWKIWLLWKLGSLSIDFTTFIDIEDLDDLSWNSYGSLDSSDIKYYGTFFKTRSSAQYRFPTATYTAYSLNKMIITGAFELWQIQKWLSKTVRVSGTVFDQFMTTSAPSQFLFAGKMQFGDGSTISEINTENTSLSTQPQANALTSFLFFVSGGKIGIEVDVCGGSLSFDTIASDGGWYFTSTDDDIDLAGAILVGADPDLNDAKDYLSISFVGCKRIGLIDGADLESCVINTSVETGTVGGLLVSSLATPPTLKDCTIKDSAGYGARIEGSTDMTLDNVSFSGNTVEKDLYFSANSGSIDVTISGGDTPDYDSAGISVNLLTSPTVFDLTNVVSLSNYEIYCVDSSSVLDSGVSSNTAVHYEQTGISSGTNIRIRVRKSSSAPKYLPYEQAAIVSGLAVSVYVSQIEDTIAG